MYITESCTEQSESNFVWRLLFTFCIIALIIGASNVFAAATDPVGDTLCNVIRVFRGQTARGIAIVGIIVLGIQTLRGQLKWEIALIIVTGVIILFKAPEFINMIAGTGTAACVS